MGKNAWKVGMASALAVGTGTVLLAETRNNSMILFRQVKDKKAKDAVCGSYETDEDSGIRLSEYRAGQSEKEQHGYLLCEGKL